MTCGFVEAGILHAHWLSGFLCCHAILLCLEILHSHCFCCHMILLWLEILHAHWLSGLLLQNVTAFLLSGDWILHTNWLSGLFLQEVHFFIKFPHSFVILEEFCNRAILRDLLGKEYHSNVNFDADLKSMLDMWIPSGCHFRGGWVWVFYI